MNVSEIWSLLKHPRRNWKIVKGSNNLQILFNKKHPRRNWKGKRKFGNNRSWGSILEGIERGSGTICFRAHQNGWSILEGIESFFFLLFLFLLFLFWSILEGIERYNKNTSGRVALWFRKHPRRNWKRFTLLTTTSAGAERSILEGIESVSCELWAGLQSWKHPRRNWK